MKIVFDYGSEDTGPLLVHEPKLLGKAWKVHWCYSENYISVDGLKMFENPNIDLTNATPHDIIEFVFNGMNEKYYGTRWRKI